MARGRPLPDELASLPWRGPGPGRPELALPPGSMPLLGPARGLRKRWRYVAAFCDELMLCAARVQVGIAGQTFWALLDRGNGELLERTRTRPPFGRGEVWSEYGDGAVWPVGAGERAGQGAVTRIVAGELVATLKIGPGSWVESICPNGAGGYVWTRKRLAPIACEIRIPGRDPIRAQGHGIEDESAGYHPRHTIWSWSAGAGLAEDGRAVGWNLVSGVNDPASNSERAIWVGGESFEPGPVSFATDLSSVSFDDGSKMSFRAEAERSASQNLGLIRSSYRQPFGSFSGSLAGIGLHSGAGVMEDHDALW